MKKNPPPETLALYQEVYDLAEAGMTLISIAHRFGMRESWVSSIVYSRASKAREMVNQEIKKGRLVRADTLTCIDCGKPAKEYDHRDYSKPLDVVPVCTRCNSLRGPGKNGKSGLEWLLPKDAVIHEAAENLGIRKEYLISILRFRQKPSATLVLKICQMFPKIKPYMLRSDIFERPLFSRRKEDKDKMRSAGRPWPKRHEHV